MHENLVSNDIDPDVRQILATPKILLSHRYCGLDLDLPWMSRVLEIEGLSEATGADDFLAASL